MTPEPQESAPCLPDQHDYHSHHDVPCNICGRRRSELAGAPCPFVSNGCTIEGEHDHGASTALFAEAKSVPDLWHTPRPGPLHWDWRCLVCSDPIAAHPSLIRRLMRRWAARHTNPCTCTADVCSDACAYCATLPAIVECPMEPA